MGKPLISHIVSGTDFSKCALRAQEYAVLLAKSYDATLHVVHVPESPFWYGSHAATILYLEQAQKEGERQLADTEQQLMHSGVKGVEIRQVVGIPSEQITKAAQDSGADLVVVGTRGRTGLDVILLGSTAERVIKGAPCPVLAIPASAEPSRERTAERLSAPTIQHILAALDFSSPSLDAAEYAIQLANHFGAKMTLLHVVEPMYYSAELEPKWQKLVHWRTQLDELAGLISSFGLAADTLLRGGVPADSIIAAAKGQSCDLIVMGTHGRRGWSRLRFGSVAEAVLREAPCPVLTVKSPKFEPGHRRVLPLTVE